MSSSWVLTAASCLRTIVGTSQTDVDLTTLQVFLGSALLDSPKLIRLASSAQLHPTWAVSSSPENRVNLGWIQLDASVARTPETYPAVLLSESEEATFSSPGTAAAVTGWGSGNALQRVDAPLRPIGDCNALLISANQQSISGESNVCAGISGSGPCAGDAGAALTGFAGASFRLVGVVSRSTDSTLCFANSANSSTALGVYTAVAPYRDFIQSNINEPLFDGSSAAALGASVSLSLAIIVLLSTFL